MILCRNQTSDPPTTLKSSCLTVLPPHPSDVRGGGYIQWEGKIYEIKIFSVSRREDSCFSSFSSRLSFYSGHSSFSMYCMMFVAVSTLGLLMVGYVCGHFIHSGLMFSPARLPLTFSLASPPKSTGSHCLLH